MGSDLMHVIAMQNQMELAQLREECPKLRAEVERLQAENAKLREALQRCAAQLADWRDANEVKYPGDRKALDMAAAIGVKT